MGVDLKIETKDNILSLAVAFPKACSKTLNKLIKTSDGLLKISVACNVIGMDYCRQIFDFISRDQWSQIDEIIKNRVSSIDGQQKEQTLLEIYRILLSESMDWEESAPKRDIFAFLRALSLSEQVKLMNGEDATHIAFISLYWGLDEFMVFLEGLQPQLRKLTILQMSRLDRIPEDSAARASEKFAEVLLSKIQKRRGLQGEDSNEAPAIPSGIPPVLPPVLPKIDMIGGKQVSIPPYPNSCPKKISPPPYPKRFVKTYSPDDPRVKEQKDSAASPIFQSRIQRLEELKASSLKLLHEMKQVREKIQAPMRDEMGEELF